ncbi:hypothetical protein KHM83_17615 [Fusibacter paucivorans]|uniref:Uncharacterized protein n=1 Tax=Fusibacter paucivorans TaxID=76009 RepID=A0ABS5PTL4_9FIRM|nr:hypothetical protein [Fusibacter paucivorans]MBS7528508.1 hypothetical protein [Fusibacter paucivorans]
MNPLIAKALDEYGFIMLNQHQQLPSVCATGETWAGFMEMIERRQVFLTNLVEKKTTLLSPALYAAISKKQQPMVFDSETEPVYTFVAKNQPVSSENIRLCLQKDKKATDKLVKKLEACLCITVLKEGKRLNQNWGTYRWGTSIKWCKDYEAIYGALPDEDFDQMMARLLQQGISPRYCKYFTQLID